MRAPVSRSSLPRAPARARLPVLALLAALSSASGDLFWAQHGGSATRSSTGTAAGPRGAVTLVDLDVSVPAPLTERAASPVAAGANGTLYYGDSGSIAYAVRADGMPLWDKQINSADLRFAAPAIAADGAIVVFNAPAAGRRLAVAFVAATGDVAWEVNQPTLWPGYTPQAFAPPLAVAASGALAEGVVLIDNYGVAQRVDALTGVVVWRSFLVTYDTLTKSNTAVLQPFALLPREAPLAALVIVGLGWDECRVTAVDVETGASVWNYSLPLCSTREASGFPVRDAGGYPAGSLAVTPQGVVLCATPVLSPPVGGNLSVPLIFALEGATGALRWSTPLPAVFASYSEGGTRFQSPLLNFAIAPNGARAYTTRLLAPAPSTNVTVLAIDVVTGAVAWLRNFTDGGSVTPAVDAEDFVYVALALGAPRTEGGNLSFVALHGANGSVAWSTNLGRDAFLADAALLGESRAAVVTFGTAVDGGIHNTGRVRVLRTLLEPLSESPSAAVTPSPTPSAGSSGSATGTASVTPTVSATPSGTPSATPSETATESSTASPSGSVTASATTSGGGAGGAAPDSTPVSAATFSIIGVTAAAVGGVALWQWRLRAAKGAAAPLGDRRDDTATSDGNGGGGGGDGSGGSWAGGNGGGGGDAENERVVSIANPVVTWRSAVVAQWGGDVGEPDVLPDDSDPTPTQLAGAGRGVFGGSAASNGVGGTAGGAACGAAGGARAKLAFSAGLGGRAVVSPVDAKLAFAAPRGRARGIGEKVAFAEAGVSARPDFAKLQMSVPGEV